MRKLKFRAYTEFGTFEDVTALSDKDFGIHADDFYKHAKKPKGQENEDWEDLLCEYNFFDNNEDYIQGSGDIVQFIGIKDADDKEIYEGDKIKGERDDQHIIEWEEKEAKYVAVCGSIRCGIPQKWITGYGKRVVGSIYDINSPGQAL